MNCVIHIVAEGLYSSLGEVGLKRVLTVLSGLLPTAVSHPLLLLASISLIAYVREAAFPLVVCLVINGV